MKQLLIPFKENQDISESHLFAFRVCNSAGYWAYRPAFYKLKNQLLEKYGHEADYDLQHIEKKCYSCGGTGWYRENNRCQNCNKGIYSRKDIVLKRFLLNGYIFHQPIGELEPGSNRLKIFAGYDGDEWNEYPTFKYEIFHGKIINVINGLIVHEPVGVHPIWAYYYLLWEYNRELFYKNLQGDLKSYQTNTQYRLKQLLDKFNPLKAYAEFFEVKKSQLVDMGDDLPF